VLPARRLPPLSPLFPYTTLFRSILAISADGRSSIWFMTKIVFCFGERTEETASKTDSTSFRCTMTVCSASEAEGSGVGLRCRLRSEEHTSELQSRGHLVCRLLLE